MKFQIISFYACLVFFLFFSILISQQKNNNIILNPYHEVEINSSNLNGERIFFIKKRKISNLVLGDIYSMNSSGGDIQKITNFSDNYYITELPELSRDGKKLTFISNYESWKSAFYTDVFIIDLSISTFSRITGFEKTSPAASTATVNVTVNDPLNWAVSSSAIRISYSGCSNFIAGNSAVLTVPANEDIWIKAEIAKAKGDLKVIKVAAGGNENIQLDLTSGTISAESCDLSLDNNNLIVSTNSENHNFPFFTLGIWNTNTYDRIAEIGAQRLGGDVFPKYSPDESMITYATGEHAVNSLGIISTTNLNGSPTILVPGSKFGIQGFCSQPVWSPDGSEIVFVYTTIEGLSIQSNLFKISVNGGNPVQLTSYSVDEIVSKPTYSPDGSKIAFNHLRSKSGNIFSFMDLINFTYTSNINYISSNGGIAAALTTDGVSIDPSWGIVNNTVDIRNEFGSQFDGFSLFQNYPNPFNSTTNIKYIIPEGNTGGSYVMLKLFDMIGKEVDVLIDRWHLPGTYNIYYDASTLTSGMYIYKLETNTGQMTAKKMILLR